MRGSRSSTACRHLCKARDAGKDQSYFLARRRAPKTSPTYCSRSAICSRARSATSRAVPACPWPRRRTAPASASSASGRSRSSCTQYLPESPGVIRDDEGRERGRHDGLAYYTLGQRHGLHIGGAPTATRRRGTSPQGRRAQRAHRRPGPRSSVDCSRLAHRERAALDRRAAARVAARRAAGMATQRSATGNPTSLHRAAFG